MLKNHDETWLRAWAGKPTREIPVSLPVAASDQPALAALLTPEVLLGASRARIEAEGWVDAVGWRRRWADGGFEALELTLSGSGAWPGERVRRILLDLEAPAVLGPEIFVRPNELVMRLDQELQGRIVDRILAEPGVAPLLKGLRFGALGDFTLDEEGIWFYYTFPVPHAYAAAAPDPWFCLGRAEAAHWLDPEGRLYHVYVRNQPAG